MTDDSFCSDISSARGEDLLGTASRVRAWLMIEQPGPWGRDALVESDLDPKVGRELKRRTKSFDVRPLLVKRAERSDRPSFLVGYSGEQRRWVGRVDAGGPVDLLDLDLGAVRSGLPPENVSAIDHPIYLVCTNGEHDSCCGRLGPEVAAALEKARPGCAWESTHVGGDRFAANLVCLPHGLYFGRVSAEDGPRIAELYEHGEIDLDHYRGRSCFVPAVQAAEIYVRRSRSLTAIDAVVPETVRTARDVWAVGLHVEGGGRIEVSVRVKRAGRRPLTCSATNPASPREFELVRMTD